MAVYNRSNTYMPNHAETMNKVYINPNFNNGFTANDQNAKPVNTIMHINPNFSHNNNRTQKNKIYINPNFIQSKSSQEHKLQQINYNNSLNNERIRQEKLNSIRCNVGNSTNYNPQPVPDKPVQVQPPATVKSRYCLVRKTEKMPIETKEVKTETIKLGKYKSVRLKDMKINLDALKQISKPPIKTMQLISPKCTQKYFNLSPAVFKTQFKIVKRNTTPNKSVVVKNPSNKTITLNSMVQNKIKVDIHKRTKYIKGKLKKNNIPCPLFRKYGRCLRNDRENCQYLHDKKHVTICRKFLKGICHDKDCLLSHELSAKKMPTCYFYLQGMCNKEECPYLHVKLNEQTKVCADFLKGYCEKGDKCLNRHVNIRNKTDKGRSIKNQYQSSNIHRMKSGKSPKTKHSVDKTHVNRIEANLGGNEASSSTKLEQAVNVTDGRYYKESNKDITSLEFEIIKPTRCKLGTLPSFIRL